MRTSSVRPARLVGAVAILAGLFGLALAAGALARDGGGSGGGAVGWSSDGVESGGPTTGAASATPSLRQSTTQPLALPSLAEPAVSPDGSEIAFVSAGDIWTVPAAGGVARLLVSHPANESRPMYSPDGKRLAFVSNRTGNGDVYVLTFDTGEVARLTCDDGGDQLDGWSRDGKWVYFSTAIQDLGAINNDAYRVSADGGTPLPVIEGLYTNEFGAAPSPDGKTTAFCAGGAANRDWWRNGHSHWDETQVWVAREGSAGETVYEPLTPPGAKDVWPMWSADGRTVY